MNRAFVRGTGSRGGGGGGTGPTKVFVPAHSGFGSVLGAPAFENDTTYGFGWIALDDASNEQFSLGFDIPNEWTTFDTFVWTVCPDVGASPGDCYFFSQIRSVGDGDDLLTGADVDRLNIWGGNVVTIAVADGQWSVERLASAVGLSATLFHDRFCIWGFHRSGQNASDNFVGDIGILGLELVRAS